MTGIGGRLERFAHKYGVRIGQTTTVLVIFALWLPILIVAFMSFAADGVLSFPPDELTLDWYFVFLNNDSAIDSILTTLQISIVATPITVALATMLSYGIGRYDFRGKNTLQILISLPLIVPLLVVGISLTLFFGSLQLGGGFVPIVASHVIRTLPFAALIILPTFLSFDQSLEESSKDLGANEIQTFFQVTLPNILPGMIAGGLLAFTISFNEFVYTYFVRGTGVETMPIYLWNQIQYTATPEVNVLSIVFLLVAVIMVLTAVFVTDVERIAQT
jgi:spermidine/putrescine transport system permease protein